MAVHRPSTPARWFLGAVSVLLLVGPIRIGAHQVAPQPIVEIFLKGETERLTVLVKLPAVVLADAKLPRDASGQLAPESSAAALQLVGQDIASNLDVQQDAERLLNPAVAATIAAGGESVDVVLTYLMRAGAGRISARLRTFRAGTDTVPTIAHYDVPPNPSRTFVVEGDPERVAFDPTASEAVQAFLTRGMTSLLGRSDFLLFALCLALPMRRSGARGLACGAFLVGELVTMLIFAAGVLTATPAILIAADMVAASAIVVAALQGITNSQSRWLAPLALIVGLALGVSTGAAFIRDGALAGSHAALALAAVLFVVTLGQIWMIALLSSAAALLYRWGLPERIMAFTAAIVAGHTSLHRLAERADSLGELGVATPDRILMTVTLGWAMVILSAGMVEIVLIRRAGALALPPLFNQRGGS